MEMTMNNQQEDQVKEAAEDTKNLDLYETADSRPSQPTVFLD